MRGASLKIIAMEANMRYKFGPAEKKDCATLAELINLASEGVVEYLFRGNDKRKS